MLDSSASQVWQVKPPHLAARKRAVDAALFTLRDLTRPKWPNVVGSDPVSEDSDEDEGPEIPPPVIDFGEGWESKVKRYEREFSRPFPSPRRPERAPSIADGPLFGRVSTSEESDSSNPFEAWPESSGPIEPGGSELSAEDADMNTFVSVASPVPGGVAVESWSDEESPFTDTPLLHGSEAVTTAISSLSAGNSSSDDEESPFDLAPSISSLPAGNSSSDDEESPFDLAPSPGPGAEHVVAMPEAPPLGVVVESLFESVPEKSFASLAATAAPERVRDSAERVVALGDEWIVDEGPDLYARSRVILESLERMGVTVASRRVLGRIAEQFRPWSSDQLGRVASHHWRYEELESLLAVTTMLRSHSPTPGEVAAQQVGRVDGELPGMRRDGGARFGDDVLLSGPAIRGDDDESRRRFLVNATRQLGEPYLRTALRVSRPGWTAPEHADGERLKIQSDDVADLDDHMSDVSRLLVDGLMFPVPGGRADESALEFVADLTSGDLASSLRSLRHDIASPISNPGGRATVVQLGRRDEWVVVTRRSDVPRAFAVVEAIESRYNVTLDSLNSMRSSRAWLGRKRRGKYRALPWFVSELEAIESALRRYTLLIGRARTSTTPRRHDGTDWRLGKVDFDTLVRPRNDGDHRLFSGETIWATRTILISGRRASAIDSGKLEKTMVHELAHALVEPDVLTSFIDDLGFWATVSKQEYGPTRARETPPSAYAHTNAHEDVAVTFEQFLTASDSLRSLHWYRFVWCVREVLGWH